MNIKTTIARKKKKPRQTEDSQIAKKIHQNKVTKSVLRLQQKWIKNF